MSLLAGEQQTLGKMGEIFVQAAHLVAASHKLALCIHQNQNRDIAAVGYDTQHLLRERQRAGGAKRRAVRDTDHRDGLAMLALSCADNDARGVCLHSMAGWKQTIENLIESHGWLP